MTKKEDKEAKKLFAEIVEALDRVYLRAMMDGACDLCEERGVDSRKLAVAMTDAINRRVETGRKFLEAYGKSLNDIMDVQVREYESHGRYHGREAAAEVLNGR